MVLVKSVFINLHQSEVRASTMVKPFVCEREMMVVGVRTASHFFQVPGLTELA